MVKGNEWGGRGIGEGGGGQVQSPIRFDKSRIRQRFQYM